MKGDTLSVMGYIPIVSNNYHFLHGHFDRNVESRLEEGTESTARRDTHQRFVYIVTQDM